MTKLAPQRLYLSHWSSVWTISSLSIDLHLADTSAHYPHLFGPTHTIHTSFIVQTLTRFVDCPLRFCRPAHNDPTQVPQPPTSSPYWVRYSGRFIGLLDPFMPRSYDIHHPASPHFPGAYPSVHLSYPTDPFSFPGSMSIGPSKFTTRGLISKAVGPF